MINQPICDLADANLLQAMREHARWQVPCECVEEDGTLMVAGQNHARIVNNGQGMPAGFAPVPVSLEDVYMATMRGNTASSDPNGSVASEPILNDTVPMDGGVR